MSIKYTYFLNYRPNPFFLIYNDINVKQSYLRWFFKYRKKQDATYINILK